MKRRSGKIMAMAGLAVMGVILVMAGFVETEIPRLVYLGIWMLCAEAIRRGMKAPLVI